MGVGRGEPRPTNGEKSAVPGGIHFNDQFTIDDFGLGIFNRSHGSVPSIKLALGQVIADNGG